MEIIVSNNFTEMKKAIFIGLTHMKTVVLTLVILFEWCFLCSFQQHYSYITVFNFVWSSYIGGNKDYIYFLDKLISITSGIIYPWQRWFSGNAIGAAPRC